MDVPTSPRQNATNSLGSTNSNASSSSTSSASGNAQRGASAAPAVPFASLLAAAKGRLAKAAAVAGRGSASAGRGSGATKTASGGEDGALDVGGHKRIAGAGGKSGRKSEGEGEGESEGEDERASEGGGESEGASVGRRAGFDERDVLDPSARHAAQLAPPGIAMPVEATSAAANEPVRARSLEELLPVLVRRIAWAGDRNKGTVRLELGAGAYAGTTVMVHAEGGRVRVEIGGSEGPELDRLRARLDMRLRGHGLDVESVT